MITLILGGNKSGKSSLGLEMLLQEAEPARMVVTGKALDMGFREQINRHRRQRPAGIEVQEADANLPSLLCAYRNTGGSLLVDSLDFWLYQVQAEQSRDKTESLLKVLREWSGPHLIFVSCEIGLGPLSANRETRQFIRDLGRLHLRLGAVSDRIYLTVAGCPMPVKGAPPGQQGWE